MIHVRDTFAHNRYKNVDFIYEFSNVQTQIQILECLKLNFMFQMFYSKLFWFALIQYFMSFDKNQNTNLHEKCYFIPKGSVVELSDDESQQRLNNIFSKINPNLSTLPL